MNLTNCTTSFMFNNADESLTYDIILLINERAPFNTVHANFIPFFQLVILQSITIVFYYMKDALVVVKKHWGEYHRIGFDKSYTKTLFFFYFLMVLIFGHMLWEWTEYFLGTTGEFFCSRNACYWLWNHLKWYRETTLGSAMDVYLGSVCTIIFLYFQYKSKIYIWPLQSWWYITLRILHVVFLGLVVNNLGVMYFNMNCGVVVIDVYVGLIFVLGIYYVFIEIWRKMDLNSIPNQKIKKNINLYYDAWAIYTITQLLFNLIPNLGTMFLVHVGWVFLLMIFILPTSIYDIYW